MASKVCPVCKVFASTSNTTLNAHIDQCLCAESVPEQVVAKFTGLKLKPRKKRSMADIYETAPIFTLEDLDRRNNTTWSTDLAFFTLTGERAHEIKQPELSMLKSGNSAVYIDSNGIKIRILSNFDDNEMEKACENIDEKQHEQDRIVEKVYPPIGNGKHKMQCDKHMKNQSKEAATSNKVQEETENGDPVCSQHVNEDPMQKTSNSGKSIHDNGLSVPKEWACFKSWDLQKKIKSKRKKRNLESLNPDRKSPSEERNHQNLARGEGSWRPSQIAVPQKLTDPHDNRMRTPKSCRSSRKSRLNKPYSTTRKFRKFSYIADTTKGDSSAKQSSLNETLLSENALIVKKPQCPTRNPESEKERQTVESTEDEGKTTSETLIAVSSDDEDNGSAADVEQYGSPSSVSTVSPWSLEDTTVLDDSALKPWTSTHETEVHPSWGSTRSEGFMIPSSSSWTRSRAVNLQVRTPNSAFCAYSKANSMESMAVQSPSGSISMLTSADSAREMGATASKLPTYNPSPSITTPKPILRLMGKNLIVASTEDASHIPRSPGFVSTSNASTPESGVCRCLRCPHHSYQQQWQLQLQSARGCPLTCASRPPMFIHEMPLHQVNGFSSPSQLHVASMEGHVQPVRQGRTRETLMPYMPSQGIAISRNWMNALDQQHA